MRRVKLDKIDLKILNDLQDDGRMTNVDLASRAGISAPPCLRRVRALEDAGVIKSYHAKVDHASLGYGVTVYAMVKLLSQSDAEIRKFEDTVRTWQLVRECYIVTGEADAMLKVVAKDWDSYQNFVMQTVSTAHNVDSVKSSVALRAVKELPGVPIEYETYSNRMAKIS